MAPATSSEFTKKYSGATVAALRASEDAVLVAPSPASQSNGRPAAATVRTSDAMLNTVRYIGLRPCDRSVHCAHALTAAMPIAPVGPTANSAQKFTACDNERFDWLRPSGSSIFPADVTTAIASSISSSGASSTRSCVAAAARHAAPAATTTTTYARAIAGIAWNAGLSVRRLFRGAPPATLNDSRDIEPALPQPRCLR